MSRRAAQTLRLLCALREAEARGARGRLALAHDAVRRRAAAEEQARVSHARLEADAETYVQRHIADMAPTRDGASIYASLAFGALQRRREANSAGLQHRRATARRAEADGEARVAASGFVSAEARANALAARRREADLVDARRATRRAEEEIAETTTALSVAEQRNSDGHP